MEKGKYDSYIQKALRMKAVDARIIETKTVVVAEWVRLKCRFGCSGYGKRLTCPPHSPTPNEMRDVLSSYKYALLVHGDEETPVTRIVEELEREIFLDGHEKAFALGAGPCMFCKHCNLEECKYPEKARPSMEASGIDVYSTVRANGLPIEVVRDENCKGNYYGLVLLD